jgi:hypothetical protein
MVYQRKRNSTYAQYARAAGANASFTIPANLTANFGLGDWIRRVRGGAGQMGKATKLDPNAVGDAVDVASSTVAPNMLERAGRHIGNNKLKYGAGAAGAAALGGGGYAASRMMDDEDQDEM